MEEDNDIINSKKAQYEEPRVTVVDEDSFQDRRYWQSAEHCGEEPQPEDTPTEKSGKEEYAHDFATEEEESAKGEKKRCNPIGKIGQLFKSFNQLARTLIILAAVMLVGMGIYSLQQRAKHRKIMRTITQTVVEVRKIKEFCTASYHEEMVVTATRKKFMKHEDLVLIVKGTVRVGFDLSTLTTEVTSDTSLTVNIPYPIVLDVITNPSDFETFQEDGHWDHELVTTYKNLARATLLNHAKADGIMQDAERNGKEKIAELFRHIGFANVTVNIVDPRPTTKVSGVPYAGGTLEIPEKPDESI